MTGKPNAGTISILETLNLLDGSFNSFAKGVADGKYAFWLGSGISRERFPMLPDLIEKVLEYLRFHADPANDECPHSIALEEALNLATLSDDERDQIDLTHPVSSWPVLDPIKQRLTNQYEQLLNIEVGDCASDVLIWEGIDVANTYANPEVEPDAEHLGLAVLIKEGVVSELASANWDGLVEKAVEILSTDASPLSVCVMSSDLQQAQNKPKLIKFHGCAVRAAENEAVYRPYLVGRASQIANWANSNNVKALAGHLEVTICERPTLMLGLSVQDFNIQSLFGAAQAKLGWNWPGDRPSYVFSEQQVTPGQGSLLQIVYRDDYAGATRAEIKEGSRIQAFAKPLLLALILYVFSEKIKRLAKTLPALAGPPMTVWIAKGVEALRNAIAATDSDDRFGFTNELIRSASRMRRLISVGTYDPDDASYEPLTDRPAAEIVRNADTLSNGLPEVSCAIALLGHGLVNNFWEIGPTNEPEATAAMAMIGDGEDRARLFIAATVGAEQRFYSDGRLTHGENAILIRAQPSYNKMQRSPSKAPGRTGKLRTREVTIPELFSAETSPEQLMEKFRGEAVI
jgi:hypothetical protein